MLGTNSNILKLLKDDVIDISYKYWYISMYAFYEYELFLMFSMTLFFYFLADFSH